MKEKKLAVPSMERLATQLSNASGNCSEPLLVPLTVTALAFSLLGMPTEMHQLAWTYFAESPDSMESMQAMWKQTVASHRFLETNIHPLTGWMGRASESDVTAAAACWQVLAGLDLLETARKADGEILGPLYTFMRSASSRKVNGAFYTPMHVSKLIAMMSDVQEGTSVTDPCCGTGGMLVAAAEVMRERGLDPRTVHWVATDIEPLAVALCGINFAAHGMGPNITLTCGDSLAPPTMPGSHTA